MTQSAFAYHHFTAYQRGRLKAGGLDWSHQPRTYKIYENQESFPLPQEFPLPASSLGALYTEKKRSGFSGAFSITTCAAVLFLAYGLTARRRGIGEELFFRSIPSAGALYPGELYLGAWQWEGIPPGLYHCDAARQILVSLRKGDFRIWSRNAFSDCIAPADAPAEFWISGIFFRSSWKYRERAYRYVLLDAGHLIENLVLALDAFGIPSSVVLDFDDEKTGLFLGLDPLKEAGLAAVRVSGEASPAKKKFPVPAPLGPDITGSSTVTTRETLFPEIIDMHRAGTPILSREASHPPMSESLGISVSTGHVLPIPETPHGNVPFAQCTLARRSRRNFMPTPLEKEPFHALTALLAAAAADHRMDPSFETCLSCGILVNAVEAMEPGFYLMDVAGRRLGQVRSGFFSDRMAAACLDQEWLQNAAAHFLFMANLPEIDRRWGARGYRYVMTAAGRLGQAIYLACAGLDMGCCGIGAFYDAETREILGLHPDAALLYLVATGAVRRTV